MSDGRATQLQAWLPLAGARVRVMWVVLRGAPLDDLVTDVQDELAHLLTDHDLRLISARWVALYGEDGAWLRADLVVTPREDEES
jgi:hypothetical protein